MSHVRFYLIILFLGLTVSLAGQTYRYVSTETLNVRSSPQVRDDNILVKLKKGDRVELIRNDGDWSLIQVGETQGYSAHQYLSTAKPPDSGSRAPIEAKVLICVSKSAYAYHKAYCSGLKRCTHTVKELTKSEAQSIGRSPCKICY
jgi:uncharacterized protein YgiM (DUF1202 family)